MAHQWLWQSCDSVVRPTQERVRTALEATLLIKHSPNTHQTPTKHPPNTHQTPTKHSPNTHQTLTKQTIRLFRRTYNSTNCTLILRQMATNPTNKYKQINIKQTTNKQIPTNNKHADLCAFDVAGRAKSVV
jgi:hypothetical protein